MRKSRSRTSQAQQAPVQHTLQCTQPGCMRFFQSAADRDKHVRIKHELFENSSLNKNNRSSLLLSGAGGGTRKNPKQVD